jgi:hypothetical protein
MNTLQVETGGGVLSPTFISGKAAGGNKKAATKRFS